MKVRKLFSCKLFSNGKWQSNELLQLFSHHLIGWIRIFKLLRSPRIDTNEKFRQPLQPCGLVRQPYSYSVPKPHRFFKQFRHWSRALSFEPTPNSLALFIVLVSGKKLTISPGIELYTRVLRRYTLKIKIKTGSGWSAYWSPVREPKMGVSCL